MEVTATLDLPVINTVARDHVELLGRDAGYVANKLSRDVALRAGGRNSQTRSADPIAARAYFDADTGRFWSQRTRNGGSRFRRPLRRMHLIAMEKMRARGRKFGRGGDVQWEELDRTAWAIRNRAIRAAGFLRFGWLYTAVIMNAASGPYKQNVKAAKVAKRVSRSRQEISRPQTASGSGTGSSRAQAENLTPTAKQVRPSPTLAQYVAYGEEGVRAAAREVERADVAFIENIMRKRSQRIVDAASRLASL